VFGHHTITREQRLEGTPDEVFPFFGDAGNLEAITPPWLGFRIDSAPAELGRGAFLRYRLALFGVPVRWTTVIARWHPPRSFVDLQLSGPYLLWEHTHRLSAVPGGTEIHDHVRYRVPGGPFAPFVEPVVGRLLAAIFDYRSERTAELLS
jgi:ligand-binding SRPBCC domain-containing protein